MTIRLIFFLFLLSSCNNPFKGVIEENYVPINTISNVISNEIENSSQKVILTLPSNDFNNDIFRPPNNNFASNDAKKIYKQFKHKSASNFFFFDEKIIFISKNSYLIAFDGSELKKYSKIEIDKKIADNYYITELNNTVYISSNFGDLFRLNKDLSIEHVISLNKNINSHPLYFNNKIIFISVKGEIINYSLINSSIDISDNLKVNFGVYEKNYKSRVYGDTLFYLFNSNSFSIINLSNGKVLNNYVLESINILSNFEGISDLVNTPELDDVNTFFVSKKGYLVNFNIPTDDILWEINFSSMIHDYIVYSNTIILMSSDKIFIVDVSSGKLISSVIHNLENPSSIIIANGYLIASGSDQIKFLNLSLMNFENDKTLSSKNKGISNLGYLSGHIYLKGQKEIYILSE